MKNYITATAPDTSVVNPALKRGSSRLDAFVLALTFVVVSGISLYLVNPSTSSNRVTVACERSTAIPMNGSRDFQQEMTTAYGRCAEESLGNPTQTNKVVYPAQLISKLFLKFGIE